MTDRRETLSQKNVQLTVDRNALREVISGLTKPGAAQEWCVACGAGRGTDLLDKVEWPQQVAKDLLTGRNLSEFVAGLKEIGDEQAWCVACGAGKDASPLERLGLPSDISDEDIDRLASRLISVMRIA